MISIVSDRVVFASFFSVWRTPGRIPSGRCISGTCRRPWRLCWCCSPPPTTPMVRNPLPMSRLGKTHWNKMLVPHPAHLLNFFLLSYDSCLFPAPSLLHFLHHFQRHRWVQSCGPPQFASILILESVANWVAFSAGTYCLMNLLTAIIYNQFRGYLLVSLHFCLSNVQRDINKKQGQS